MAKANFIVETPVIDDGLRAYMLKIYVYMGLALVLTGVVAMTCAQSQAFLNAMYVMANDGGVALRPLAWLVMLAPLVLAIVTGFGLKSINAAMAQAIYWLYAVLMGASLSMIFLTFTGESIALVVFIAAGTFGGMSLYGYTTRRSLTGWGSFLLMALIGLILTMVVNVVLNSSALMLFLSVAGVLVFTGLTAFDTQRLKARYNGAAGTGEDREKIAIIGALTLYLDVINLFLNLLNLFGGRRLGRQSS